MIKVQGDKGTAFKAEGIACAKALRQALPRIVREKQGGQCTWSCVSEGDSSKNQGNLGGKGWIMWDSVPCFSSDTFLQVTVYTGLWKSREHADDHAEQSQKEGEGREVSYPSSKF